MTILNGGECERSSIQTQPIGTTPTRPAGVTMTQNQLVLTSTTAVYGGRDNLCCLQSHPLVLRSNENIVGPAELI
jgi:hypothetical protein